MELNGKNYFSTEMNRKYLSVSTVKSIQECESMANAVLHKGYSREEKSVFLHGKYLHAWCEGKLDEFKAEHPELYSTRGKTAGQLKADFKGIENIIENIKEDKTVMFHLSGKKEFYYTGEIEGIPFKIMVDVLNEENGFFTDLKFMRSISDKFWNEEQGRRINFIEKYNYILQMAVYQEIIYQNIGKKLDPYIVVYDKAGLAKSGVDKNGGEVKKYSDKAIIYFDQESLDGALEALRVDLKRVVDVWQGKVKDLHRCGVCDYCKATNKIKAPILWSEL